MIIPVRCFTCGKVLADKWDAYVDKCTLAEQDHQKKTAAPKSSSADSASSSVGLAGSALERPGSDGKTSRGIILDQLGITSPCCRTMMMSHVDLSKII